MVAVRLVNDHFPACRGQRNEILVLHWNPSAVGDMG